MFSRPVSSGWKPVPTSSRHRRGRRNIACQVAMLLSDYIAQGRITFVALVSRSVSHQIAFGQVLDRYNCVGHGMRTSCAQNSPAKRRGVIPLYRTARLRRASSIPYPQSQSLRVMTRGEGGRFVTVLSSSITVRWNIVRSWARGDRAGSRCPPMNSDVGAFSPARTTRMRFAFG